MNRKEYHRLYYLAHKDEFKNYAKNYRQTEKGKLVHKIAMKKYRRTERGKLLSSKITKKYRQSFRGKDTHNKTNKNYAKKNPEKIKAINFINHLLQSSDFTRDICSTCGKSNAEFHHENYDLPNFGYWFCNKHHNEIHRRD